MREYQRTGLCEWCLDSVASQQTSEPARAQQRAKLKGVETCKQRVMLETAWRFSRQKLRLPLQAAQGMSCACHNVVR